MSFIVNTYHRAINFTIFDLFCFHKLPEFPKIRDYIRITWDLFSILTADDWNKIDNLCFTAKRRLHPAPPRRLLHGRKPLDLIVPVGTAPLGQVTSVTAKTRLALAMGGAIISLGT